MSITLPMVPIQALRNDPRLLLIYGAPKIGKTTILTQLPIGKYLILETDSRGCEFVSACHVQLNNLVEFVEYEQEIKKTKPYDFVAVDTIDNLEIWAEREATRLYKASPIGKNFGKDSAGRDIPSCSVLDLPNGGGYMYLRQVFTNIITRMLDIAPQVIFVGHIRDKLIGQINGQDETTSRDLDLTGKIKQIVCSLVDSIGYVSRDRDSNLTISFKTHELITNGSRAPHLKGKNFTMKGSTFDWSLIYPDYFKKIETK